MRIRTQWGNCRDSDSSKMPIMCPTVFFFLDPNPKDKNTANPSGLGPGTLTDQCLQFPEVSESTFSNQKYKIL